MRHIGSRGRGKRTVASWLGTLMFLAGVPVLIQVATAETSGAAPSTVAGPALHCPLTPHHPSSAPPPWWRRRRHRSSRGRDLSIASVGIIHLADRGDRSQGATFTYRR